MIFKSELENLLVVGPLKDFECRYVEYCQQYAQNFKKKKPLKNYKP
jgi:hypothetical protein